MRIIATIQRFIKKLKERVNLKRGTSNKENPSAENTKLHQQPPPSSKAKLQLIFSEEEIKSAENYFFKKATAEIKHFLKENQYKRISKERDGILYYTGRILPNQNVTVVGRLTNVMKDLQQTSFCVPIIERHSPLAYSIVNEIHWYNNIAKHAGIETVLRYTLSIAHIIEGREIVKRFKKDCHRCRLLAKRTIEVSMGPVSAYNLTIAPAFYYTQVDLAGPFKAYTFHNKRKSIKIWLCVFCCSTTSTISIKVMEDYSSSSFVQCFIRLSCEVGYPKKLLPDEGSQLITGCESMKIDFQDTRFQLHQQMNVEYEKCPTAAHHMYGKVEQKIWQIKESILKTIMNERLSILQWETLAAEISNSINNLPLAIGNITGDLENLDLITPNRLRLGRNNDRSPTGPLTVSNNPKIFLKSNEEIFNAWFENWLITHVPKLMHQPKWWDNEREIKEDDIVLFLKNEGALKNTYQYGKIKAIERSQDKRIRKVIITYRNHNESVNRETRRGVRQIVTIHPVDETNIVTELGEIATSADISYHIASKC